MTYAWGIDTGSSRAGFAFINVNTGEFLTSAVVWREKGMDLARSLTACRESVRRFSEAMKSHRPPSTIAFEKPMGKFPNPSLVMHAGVTVEAACSGTELSPWSCAVTEWKKAVVGTGAATKDFYTEWAMGLGCPDDPDQAAALGVAAYAAKFVAGLDLSRLVPMHRAAA